jgi:acylphosphatase
MKHAFDAIVSGRVQMVMYRDFIQRKASLLGVVGEAENMPDGTVHIRAEGERDALETLIEHVKKGSMLARVESVSMSWVEPSGVFNDFSIKHHHRAR